MSGTPELPVPTDWIVWAWDTSVNIGNPTGQHSLLHTQKVYMVIRRAGAVWGERGCSLREG